MEIIQKQIIKAKNGYQNLSELNKSNKKQTSDTINDKSIYENKDYLIKVINATNQNFFETFELIDFIKSGSEGLVYEGTYKKTKTKVGFKFYIKNKNKEKKTEEIDYLKKLKNKGIISLYGFIKISELIDVSIVELAKW